MALPRSGKIVLKNSALFICDIQEKFRKTVQYFPQIINVAGRLLAGANVLDMPVIVTEQYPKGNKGHTTMIVLSLIFWDGLNLRSMYLSQKYAWAYCHKPSFFLYYPGCSLLFSSQTVSLMTHTSCQCLFSRMLQKEKNVSAYLSTDFHVNKQGFGVHIWVFRFFFRWSKKWKKKFYLWSWC